MFNATGALAAGITEVDHWQTERLHVSDLGATQYISIEDRKCPRQVYLRLNNAEKAETGPGKQLMFEQGNHLEAKAVEWLNRGLRRTDSKYYMFGQQINVSSGILPLRGTLDILITDGKDYCITDFKTRRSNHFKYQDKVRPADMFQVAGYIYAWNSLFKQHINKGKVIEIDREGQNFVREFDFIYDDILKKKIEIAMHELINISRGYKPPKMPPKIKINSNKGPDSVCVDNPWQCNYCDYKDHSCAGAVPKKYDDHLGRVVGHIKDGVFDEKIEGISDYVDNDLLKEG